MLAVAGDEALKFRIGIVKHVCSAFRWKEPHGVALTCQARYVSRCRDCSTEFAFQALAPVRGLGFLGVGSGLTFCRAVFDVFVDDVFEPGIRPLVAAAHFKRRRESFFLNKPIDVLAGVLYSLRFQVFKTDNNSSHRDALTCCQRRGLMFLLLPDADNDEQFVASGHPK